MTTSDLREIRFNYTSADDRQVVTLLLGAEGWSAIERLRARRVTGRLARLLMRVLGEIFIHRRNPFLVEELVLDPRRRRHLFGNLADDLALIGRQADGDPLMPDVLARAATLLETFRREMAGLPAERERIRRRLGAIVGAANVLFDPFTLVSHATDATDWRLSCRPPSRCRPRRSGAAAARRRSPRSGCTRSPAARAPASPAARCRCAAAASS